MSSFLTVTSDMPEPGNYLARRQDEIQKRIQEAVDDAINKSLPSIFDYLEKTISDLYQEAVDEFYNDYKPKKYKRNESLRNILKITRKPMSIRIDYDEDQMTLDRRGGSLFEKVFEKGYHGGAESGEGHPDPETGTPYWRAGYHFSRWGQPAKRADVSAYVNFNRKLDDNVSVLEENIGKILGEYVSKINI